LRHYTAMALLAQPTRVQIPPVEQWFQKSGFWTHFAQMPLHLLASAPGSRADRLIAELREMVLARAQQLECFHSLEPARDSWGTSAAESVKLKRAVGEIAAHRPGGWQPDIQTSLKMVLEVARAMCIISSLLNAGAWPEIEVRKPGLLRRTGGAVVNLWRRETADRRRRRHSLPESEVQSLRPRRLTALRMAQRSVPVGLVAPSARRIQRAWVEKWLKDGVITSAEAEEAEDWTAGLGDEDLADDEDYSKHVSIGECAPCCRGCGAPHCLPATVAGGVLGAALVQAGQVWFPLVVKITAVLGAGSGAIVAALVSTSIHGRMRISEEARNASRIAKQHRRSSFRGLPQPQRRPSTSRERSLSPGARSDGSAGYCIPEVWPQAWRVETSSGSLLLLGIVSHQLRIKGTPQVWFRVRVQQPAGTQGQESSLWTHEVDKTLQDFVTLSDKLSRLLGRGLCCFGAEPVLGPLPRPRRWGAALGDSEAEVQSRQLDQWLANAWQTCVSSCGDQFRGSEAELALSSFLQLRSVDGELVPHKLSGK